MYNIILYETIEYVSMCTIIAWQFSLAYYPKICTLVIKVGYIIVRCLHATCYDVVKYTLYNT